MPEIPISPPSLSPARTGVNTASHFLPFSTTTIRARDVILIHPSRADLDPDTGEGSNPSLLVDHITAMALDQRCRVTIIPVAMQNGNSCMQAHQNLSLQGDPHDISCFYQPMFIIVPTGSIPQEALQQQLELLCDTHQFPRQDLVLIESADTSTPYKEPQLIRTLKESGFERISANKLDLCDATSPYWLLDQARMRGRQGSFEVKLTKLLDSFNLSIKRNANYQLEFIDSDAQDFSMPTFLQQMLANHCNTNMGSNAHMDSNFILIWPQLERCPHNTLPASISELLQMPTWISDAPHFSRLQLFCAYADTKRLKQVLDIQGCGQRKITIVFAGSQNKEICLSTRFMFPGGIQERDPNPGLQLAQPARRPRYDEAPG